MQFTRHRECRLSSLYNGGYGAILYKSLYSALYRKWLYTTVYALSDA